MNQNAQTINNIRYIPNMLSKFYSSVFSTIIFIFVLQINLPIYAQTIHKSILLNRNRKNESMIKPSPLSSGHEHTSKTISFSYEPTPTAAMKNRVKRILPPSSESNDIDQEYDEEIAKILGSVKDNDSFFGEQSTVIKELDEEADKAIQKHQESTIEAMRAKQIKNIADYAASVEAKKKREEEERLAALNPPQQQSFEESPLNYYEEENNDQESLVISTGTDGKIKIKQPAKPNIIASDTASATQELPVTEKK